MASDNVIDLSDNNFHSEVLESDLPVVVDFWAQWCAPCRAISPLIDQLATQYNGKVRVGKLNIDDNQGVAQKYSIMSIPTLLVFRNGEVVHQLIGGHPQKIQDLFASASG